MFLGHGRVSLLMHVVIGWAYLLRMLAFVPRGSHPEPVSPGSDSQCSPPLPCQLGIVWFTLYRFLCLDEESQGPG